jgi:hypothetical protein
MKGAEPRELLDLIGLFQLLHPMECGFSTVRQLQNISLKKQGILSFTRSFWQQ